MLSADKSLRDYARKLVPLSLDESGLVSTERVAAVLEALKAKPHRRLNSLFKLYLHYIRLEIRRSEAIVEHAGALPETTIDTLTKGLSETQGRTITAISRENADLIAGLRVSLGDNVYDASVAGALDALATSID